MVSIVGLSPLIGAMIERWRLMVKNGENLDLDGEEDGINGLMRNMIYK